MKQVFASITTKNQVDLDEVMQVGSGAAKFASQFKPHALGPTNAKSLLLKDEDYSTPDDQYFGYINKRHSVPLESEMKKELEIVQSLGLEIYLPPTYNFNSGKFEEATILDAKTGLPINPEEADVFELARLRGTNIRGVKELMNDKVKQQTEH